MTSPPSAAAPAVGPATDPAAFRRLQVFSPGATVGSSRTAGIAAELADALPDLRIRALFEARPDLLSAAEHVIVAVDGADRAVGLLAASSVQLPGGVAVLQAMVQFVGVNQRGGRVLRESWTRLLGDVTAERGFPDVVALKTFNPVAYCAMRALGRSEQVYPALAGPQEPGMRLLATRVAAAVAAGYPFEPDTGVIRGSGRPTDLYLRRPESSDPEADRHFAAHTRPGDRVLCLVRFGGADAAQQIHAGLQAGPG